MTWREEASTERRGARQRASRWLRPVLVAALILRCTTVFGAPAGDDEDRKLDGSLRHRVRQGSSSERVSVIVTPRRGARARILSPDHNDAGPASATEVRPAVVSEAAMPLPFAAGKLRYQGRPRRGTINFTHEVVRLANSL